MFGDDSFGVFGFGESESDAVLPDSLIFREFLERVTSARCWLLEIGALYLASNTGSPGTFSGVTFGELGFGEAADADEAGIVDIYYSTHGYTTHEDDTPSRTWYEGRLKDGITVNRQIAGKAGVGGLARVFSEVVLANVDGALDTITSDYGLDGREVQILVGDPEEARSTFGLVFTGTISTVTIGLDEVRFRLSDGSDWLDLPLNSTVYEGSGGLEGGADLAGKPKPKAYGEVFNISPPLVDSSNLIYQVHDGVISDVPAVYDRQVALTKVAGAPSAGQYQVTVATGTFKLGAQAAGQVTCNVLGDASGAGYVDRTADIIGRILRDQVALYDTQIDPTSFAALNDDAPASVGIWIGTDGKTSKAAIAELLGASYYGGFSRYGTFTVGMVSAAAGEQDATYTEQDIKEIERLPLPSEIEPISWRTSVGYQKNYTVQTDVAAAVTAARRTFAAQDYRFAIHEDDAIRSRHILATEFGPVAALYAEEADAQDEADRLFELWAADRRLLRIVVPFSALTLDIGRTVFLSHPRFGLSQGALSVILSHALTDTDITLTVLV